MSRRFGALLLVVTVLLGAHPALATPARAAAAPTGRIAYQGADRALHLIGADGSGDRTVSARGDIFTPRWSPSGTTIVYSDELTAEPYKGQLGPLRSRRRDDARPGPPGGARRRPGDLLVLPATALDAGW